MTNEVRVRQSIRGFAFPELFSELGWDNLPGSPRRYDVGDATFTLSPIRQKRGYQVYECSPASDGDIPLLSVRTKIERLLTRDAREHLIIFVNRARTVQHWQWVRREPGQPLSSRSHVYHKGQVPDALVQKLERLRVSLDEEEHIGISDVAGRTRQAFDTERVTKRFYDQFKQQHEGFRGFIAGITDVGDRDWYASLMLNRLMFVYFIQRKGFLDNDIDYLPHRLARMQRDHGKDQFHTFYRAFLLVLFHDGFAAREDQRSPDVRALIGKIPYLNGGLFELHEIEDRYGADIQIPDAAFEAIFAFFAQWEWHLDTRSDRPGNEINPDVLGYIFEKFINQKQMGAYYTKEDITGYIGQNTIIPWLFDRAKRDCEGAFKPDGEVWRLLAERPDYYIYPAVRHGVDLPLPPDIAAGIDDVAKRTGWNHPAPSGKDKHGLPTETWREYIARRTRCLALREKLAQGEVTTVNDLITENLHIREFAQAVLIYSEGANLLEAFYDAIAGTPTTPGITVLDPTCGSGAFLFAALELLSPLYDACIERMTQFVDEADRLGDARRHPKFRAVLAELDDHPNREYFITKKIIVNNLYGVDIMAEATEICKLRLFLTLAAQIERAEQIEPLPDIDFNIRAGNTLVGFTSYADVERASGVGGQGKLDLFGDAARIANRAKVAALNIGQYRDAQAGGTGAVATLAKAALRDEQRGLADELDRYLAAEYGIVERESAPVEYAAAFARWRETHQPFHWYSEFYSIMERGGFDVIIGNPPYVEYSEVKRKSRYTIMGYKTEQCGNLYAFAFERAVHLTDAGKVGFVIPVASVCTDGYESLRQVLHQTGRIHVSSFNDRPSKLFDGLEHIRLAIILLSRGGDKSIYTTKYNKWSSKEREPLFSVLQYHKSPVAQYQAFVAKIGNRFDSQLMNKVGAKNRGLNNVVVKNGAGVFYYTRKLSGFVQILNFVPRIVDGSGVPRDPSELKAVSLPNSETAELFLAALNSSLFYWYLTVSSDCRNLNKREVFTFPFDAVSLPEQDRSELRQRTDELMQDMQHKSKMIDMNYERLGRMSIQCIYPKLSKPIIDEIDRVLARHYGFTAEELDYIINYDIKYRMGADAVGEDGA